MCEMKVKIEDFKRLLEILADDESAHVRQKMAWMLFDCLGGQKEIELPPKV